MYAVHLNGINNSFYCIDTKGLCNLSASVVHDQNKYEIVYPGHKGFPPPLLPSQCNNRSKRPLTKLLLRRLIIITGIM